MQIEINNDEYRALVALLEVGWEVICGNYKPACDFVKPYEDVIQKVFLKAEEAGQTEIIDKHEDRYYITRAFEEELEVYTDQYNEEIFWFRLASRLGNRDMIEDLGEEKLKSMSRDERFKESLEREEYYNTEFETHGISRLRIVE